MEANPLSPLEQKPQGISVPINDYHVEFWTHVSGDLWESSEWRITSVADICEALAWADAEARRRGATYTLQAVIDTGDAEERVWLGGNNPTWGKDEYERSLPVETQHEA